MCFDGIARVSRAAAPLAFFVADVLDVSLNGKFVWNLLFGSICVHALPVLMLATVFFKYWFSIRIFSFFSPRGVSRWTPNMGLSWASSWEASWSYLTVDEYSGCYP